MPKNMILIMMRHFTGGSMATIKKTELLKPRKMMNLTMIMTVRRSQVWVTIEKSKN